MPTGLPCVKNKRRPEAAGRLDDGALSLRGAGAPSAFFGDQAIYEQDNNGADNRAYPSGAFAGLVETQGTAQIASDDRTDNTQDDGQANAQLLVARHNGPGKPADDEANDDQRTEDRQVGKECDSRC